MKKCKLNKNNSNNISRHSNLDESNSISNNIISNGILDVARVVTMKIQTSKVKGSNKIKYHAENVAIEILEELANNTKE